VEFRRRRLLCLDCHRDGGGSHGIVSSSGFWGGGRPWSHQGAGPRGRPSPAQGLYFIRAFLGIEAPRVPAEERNVVVDEDAVAAEQLARPGDRLTRLGRRERLRKRRLLVRKLALVRELCCASHHALAGRDVAEHLRKLVLNELERADRLSELQSLL